MRSQIPAAETGKETTILIVEDEAQIRFLMEIALRRAGFTVLAAGCGADGLNLFYQTASAIDLLITDISLPKIRGTELAERVREVRGDLPVIYASGSFRMEPFNSDEYVPGAGYLAKPFSMAQLLEAVDLILNPRFLESRPA
jgi:DNA-binding response OmpR family regulator